MRATISTHLVVDDEIGIPTKGGVLRNLGLRLMLPCGELPHGQPPETLVGNVVWSRRDVKNGMDESVIDTGAFRVLTQEEPDAGGELLRVGSTATLTGRVVGVGAYEYDDFSLPDVRRDWLVESVDQDDACDWKVALEPLA